MKYLIFALCILFLIADAIFEINPILKNLIYGFMTLYAVYHFYMNKDENGLGDIFKKDQSEGEEPKKSKSIFNMKDLFKK